jgi:2,5-diamino-6-(ribosylamino)-4(3H)-pyrimidinone 5'-phosphate reductase
MPYTVINAVSTLDGRAALGGKSSPIGSAGDRLIMRNIRSAFDAVLVGAGTLRAENLDLAVPQDLAQQRRDKGLREQPIPIILAGLSPLPKGRKLYEHRGLIILGPKSVQEQHFPAEAAFRALPEWKGGRVDIKGVLRILEEEFGVGCLLVEGGPSVNRSFLSAGYVDELFLTVAPKISGGGDAPNIVSGAETLPDMVIDEARLVSVHAAAGGELYLRYRLR